MTQPFPIFIGRVRFDQAPRKQPRSEKEQKRLYNDKQFNI
jgi:hypothetical protein